VSDVGPLVRDFLWTRSESPITNKTCRSNVVFVDSATSIRKYISGAALLLFGLTVALPSARSQTTYTLVGPQNTPDMTYTNGRSTINADDSKTYSNPEDSTMTMTVSGTFLATVTGPSGPSNVNEGVTVTTGSVLVSDTNSGGFAAL
jgi:hypothetical protein